MAQFYLTLPSNSSMKYYSNNTLTRFTTRLENPISLTGSWEVGLAEIQYQQTWYNLERGEGKFTYSQTIKNSDKISSVSGTLRIPPGFYDTVEDLINAINQMISNYADTAELSRHAIFHYNPITRRVQVTIPSGVSINLSKPLCAIFGITSSQNPVSNYSADESDFRGNECCDINRGQYSLFVYCNILEHVPVGDTKAPLLRIVHNNGKSGDIVHRIYEKPLYVPLQQKAFDSIEIDIRSDAGKSIPFEYGKLVVILHFRLSKLPYLLQ